MLVWIYNYGAFLPILVLIPELGVIEDFNYTIKLLLSRLLVDEIWMSLVPRAVFVVITSRLIYGSLISVALFTLIVILGFFKLFTFEPPLVPSSFFWFTLLEPLRYLFLAVREFDPLEASAFTLPPSIRAPLCWLL